MTASSPQMDLSRLYRSPPFRTTSIPDSCRQLGPELSEHRLRCGAGGLDYSLHATRAQRARLMILRYGPEVEINTGGFHDFFLVQMPLRGTVDILSDGRQVSVQAGQAAVVAPRRELRLRWSRDSEQLILRLPRQLMHEAAEACAGWPAAGAELCSAAHIEGLDFSRWCGQLQGLMSALPGDGEMRPGWLGELEFGLALLLLTQQSRQPGPTTSTAASTPTPPPNTPRSASLGEPLAAAERYAMARLCAPIALEDLAHAAGVSSRTLHMHCKRRFGVGPMVWLRHLRLDAARRQLEQGHGRITEVALDYGFGHLGRFSSYYKDRFGELPRETAARR